MNPSTEQIVQWLRSGDNKQRLNGVQTLANLLEKDINFAAISWKEFLSCLIPTCLRDNHMKISITSLECVALLISSLSNYELRPYLNTILKHVAERLGDGKLPVREKARQVIISIVEVYGFEIYNDKLQLCLKHKNWRVREQILLCLSASLSKSTIDASCFSKLTVQIVSMLEDSNKEVRNAAIESIEEVYKHIGPSLLTELRDKKLRPTHMKVLEEKLSSLEYAAVEQEEPLTLVRSRTKPRSQSRLARQSSTTSERSTDSTNQSLEAELSIDPVSASSERDAVSKLKDVEKDLRSSAWNTRVQGMRKLQQYLCGNIHENFECFYPMMTSVFRELLQKQASDLRSAVVREACQTIHVLAVKLPQSKFDPLAIYFVSTLLKMTAVTIQIISKSADECILNVIKSSSGYHRTLARLMEEAKSKSTVLRTNCVKYIYEIVADWDHSYIEKIVNDQFETVVPSFLTDAQSDVRVYARKLFFLLRREFPGVSEAIYARLDSTAQKYLQEEENCTQSASRSQSRRGNVARQSAKSSSLSPEENNAAPSRNGRSETLGSNRAERRPDGNHASAKPSFHEKPTRVLLNHSSKAENTTGGNGSNAVSGPKRVFHQISSVSEDSHPPPPPRAKPFGFAKSWDSNDKASHSRAGPLRVEVTPSSSNSSAETPKNASSKSLENNHLKPQRVLQSVRPIDSRVPGSGSKSNETRTEVTGPQRILSSSPSSSRSANNASPTRSSTKASNSDAGSDIEDAPLDEKDRLHLMLEKATSSLWSNRVEAMQQLLHFVKQHGQSIEPERIVKVLLNHLNDAHFKVYQTVLEGLSEVIPTLKDALKPRLLVFLPKIFLKLVDSKEQTRRLGVTVLEQLKKTFDSSFLIDLLLTRVLECNLTKYAALYTPSKMSNNMSTSTSNTVTGTVAMKVRLFIVDFIVQLVPASGDYFSANVRNVRYCLKKLRHLIEREDKSGTGANDLKAQEGSLVASLYENFPEEIKSILTSSNATIVYDFQYLPSLLQSHVPEFQLDEVLHEHQVNDNHSREEDPSIKVMDEEDRPEVDEEESDPSLRTALLSEEVKYPEYDSVTSENNTKINKNECSEEESRLAQILNILSQKNQKQRTATEVQIAMQQLVSLAKNHSEAMNEIWERYITRALFTLLDIVKEEVTGSIQLLEEFLRHQSGFTRSHVREILLPILQSCCQIELNPITNEVCPGTSSFETLDLRCHLAENLLTREVTSKFPIESLFHLLPLTISCMHQKGTTMGLLVLIRLVTAAVRAVPSKYSLIESNIVLEIVDIARKGLAHSNSHVRKCSVLLLVALSFSMEENEFAPHLNSLDIVPRKLVSFYIRKEQQKVDPSPVPQPQSIDK